MRPLRARAPARPARPAWPATLAAAVLLLAAATWLPRPALEARTLPAPASTEQARDGRIDGEHGLWVHFTADSLRVQWLMETPRPGRLIVLHGSDSTSVETPTGSTHRALLPRPAAETLTLRYGAAGIDESLLFETFVDLREPARPRVIHEALDSIYIVGDTHGVYDALVAGLHGAGLVDDQLRWSGGRNHLVFAGDLVDRGPDVMQLLWFVYRLEREAAEAGGRVHVVLGNHEIMVMLADLRYVHPKEQMVAEMHGVAYDRLFDVRHTVLGRWLATRPAAIRIGRVLVAHGGITPAHLPLEALDDSLRTYVSEELFHKWADSTAAPIAMDSATYQRRENFFFDRGSVFWHRAYVQTDTATATLDEMLRLAEADLLVVGHTPVATMHARYDERVIAAHTPRFGAELLLLVRDGDGYRRYRVANRSREPFE